MRPELNERLGCRIKPSNKWSALTTVAESKMRWWFFSWITIRYIPLAIPLTTSQRHIYGTWMSDVGSDDHISMRHPSPSNRIFYINVLSFFFFFFSFSFRSSRVLNLFHIFTTGAYKILIHSFIAVRHNFQFKVSPTIITGERQKKHRNIFAIRGDDHTTAEHWNWNMNETENENEKWAMYSDGTHRAAEFEFYEVRWF